MKTRVVISRILFLIYLCVVAYLCLHTFKDSQIIIPAKIWGLPGDNLVHFLMFLPFPFLAYISYDKRNYTDSHSLLFALATLALGVIVAGASEVGQKFTQTRTPDPYDFLADCAAIAVMTLIILVADIIGNHSTKKTSRKRCRR